MFHVMAEGGRLPSSGSVPVLAESIVANGIERPGSRVSIASRRLSEVALRTATPECCHIGLGKNSEETDSLAGWEAPNKGDAAGQLSRQCKSSAIKTAISSADRFLTIQ